MESPEHLSFKDFMRSKNENRRLVKIVSKALALIEMEEVAGLRNLLLEEGSFLTIFRYEITQFGVEKDLVPKEWVDYINPGESLLHFACLKGNKLAVELLLSFGSDVNCQSLPPRGETPLHIAAVLRDVKMLDLLLEYGALSKAKNATAESAFLIEKFMNCEGQFTIWLWLIIQLHPFVKVNTFGGLVRFISTVK